MYDQIFNEVVSIMREDYAGSVDKKGWDYPELYRSKIAKLSQEDRLTPQIFTEIVEDYLLDFKDPHMAFKAKRTDEEKSQTVGFEVRRYEDKLYVTKITGEDRVNLGDALISLDETPILSLVEKHERQLMEKVAEREDWRNVLTKYKQCQVIDEQGDIRLLDLKSYETKQYVPTYSLENINPNTLLLTLTDFSNPDEITTLIRENEQNLSAGKNLIIDVRVNYGGSDAAYFELLPYLFEDEPNTEAFMRDYAMEFNCTDRNAQLQIKNMKKALSQVNDKQFKHMLQRLIAKWEDNRGKGFVSFGQPTVAFPTGKRTPRNIIVLTDVMCGSSGDVFAYICKMSPKVKVVGRPTAGLNDYSNLTKMEWDQFEFWYPTSRLKQIDYRDGNFTYGIKPHIYIPWTPDHTKRDVDMENALRLLEVNDVKLN